MAEGKGIEARFGSLLAVLSGIFFVSGFSALLYQVAWQRLLGLFSGSDVRSATIITAAYLGGLGIGNLVGSLWADRLSSQQAVRAYGFCNLSIALFAFLSPRLYYDLLFLELNELATSPLVMLVVVFLSLLFPTTLMGLSLPLVSKALVRNLGNAPHRISRLYALNTLGAGLGTILSGWVLVGVLGYENTIYVGATLSLSAGLAALLLSRQFRTDDRPEAHEIGEKLDLRHLPRSVWMWCFLVFVSGFIAISLEILWFRILGVTLRSNAYTFAHLLAFFLIGDAFGSYLGTRFLRRIDNPRRTFIGLQGLIALYSIGAIWVTALLMNSSLMNRFGEALPESGALELSLSGDFGLIWAMYFVLPFFLVAVPAVMIGFYFPIVQKAVQTDGEVVGQRVGIVEVANIIGNTLGSILTGTLLLDQLGTPNTLRLLALLGLIFMGVLLWEAFREWIPSAKFVNGGMAAGLGVILLAFPSAGNFWSKLHHIQAESRFLVAEDSTGVSAIEETPQRAIFYANGMSQGELPFLSIHGFLGTTPALVHPNPQRIMLIGIGSAATPYAVGIRAETEEIVLVEIVSSELEVLREYEKTGRYGAPIAQMYDDPRYEIVLGDGRRVLALSEEKFDIIQADAIYPTSSHSGLLYSQEFFAQVRAKLAPGGIMAQWRPTERVEQTFIHSFPFVVNVGDALLLGSDSPIPYNREEIYDRFFEPHLAEYLKAGNFDPEQVAVINLFTGGEYWYPETPRPPADDLNTDLFPRDEYYLNNGEG